MNEHEQEAYDLGVQYAKNAASWVIDGNTSQDHVTRMVAWLDDGDPRADDYLPTQPNLSGEFADDLTPASLAGEILGDDTDDDGALLYEDTTIVDALADAYEAGVMDTFMTECERILHAAVLSTHEL